MLLGVVSDTHGHTGFTMAAVRMLESLDVQTVLHCGDIGAEEIVPLFARWPTHFVLGNVDYARFMQEAIEEAGQHYHERFGQLELEGVAIAFLHGDDEKLLAETIHGGQYALVCHGHTHKKRLEHVGQTLVLNPGALYRTSQHSIAVVQLPELEVTHVPVT
jgi:putative phosphoesterase